MEPQRIAYLHAGMVKTGSSYLQAQFAAMRHCLLEYDISYPISDSLAAKVMAGFDTAGNGQAIIKASAGRDTTRLEDILDSIKTSNCLFSSELVYVGVSTMEDFNRLSRVFACAGFKELRFLIYVRDVLPHCLSWYLQKLKTQPNMPTLYEFIATYGEIGKAARFLGLCEDAIHLSDMNIVITCRNYDSCKTSLLKDVYQWLDVDLEEAIMPGMTIRNRSMTELEALCSMMLSAKGISPKSFIETMAMNKDLLRVAAYTPDVPPEMIDQMYARNRQAITIINGYLPPNQCLPYSNSKNRLERPTGCSINAGLACKVLSAFAEEYSKYHGATGMPPSGEIS